jgi:hypothetical protein
MLKWLLIVFVTLIALSLVTPICAEWAVPDAGAAAVSGTPAPPPGPSPMGMPRGPMWSPALFRPDMTCPVAALRIPMPPEVKRLTDELKLTEDQQTKLSDLVQKFQSKWPDMSDASRNTSKALKDEIAKSDTTKAKVAEAAAKAVKAESAMLDAETGFWMDFKALLTADQNKSLGDLLQKGPVIRPFNRPSPPANNGGTLSRPLAVPPPPPAAPPSTGGETPGVTK